ATTYNVAVEDQYGNNNITIRDNRIIARNLNPGIATCYSVCVIGDNLTVENNYIENSNNYLIMTQYRNDEYIVEGDTGSLTIRNNSFATGKIDIKFDPCIIEDNTFYGNVTLVVTNNTLTNNNVNRDANENPYISYQSHVKAYNIILDAPETYIYDDSVNVSVSVIDTSTNTPVTRGYLEVYADGILYDNITITNNQSVFSYANESFGTHHIRVWYNNEEGNLTFIQKLVNLESIPITGQLVLDTVPSPQIGDNITLRVSYTLNKDTILDNVNITFTLPGQNPITVPAKDNSASIDTIITTNYIRKIGSMEREQSISITATTGTEKIQINGINTKLGVQKANTQITITPTTTIIGQETTITATITTNNNLTINTGTVTFTDENGNKLGEKSVTKNTATITLTFNEPGNHIITANYDGTTYYNATEKSTTITITKLNTKITINNINTTKYNENTTITGKLTDENNNKLTDKNITITINKDQITTTTDEEGTFTITIQANTIGTNNITINYQGNNNYNPTNTKTNFTVNKQNTELTVNTIKPTTIKDKITITGKLTDNNGNALTNTNIKITINKDQITTTTDTTGQYTYTYTTGTTGTNNITVSYDGNNNYNPTNTKTNFTVNKQNTKLTVNNIKATKYNDNMTITGKLTDNNG
ncbi:MAG: hypothetical protein BZ138_06825, partial [Methanosphaera sp. rholeuAM270]